MSTATSTRTRIPLHVATARAAHPCTTCGGATSTGIVMAEGVDPETGCLVRCCSRCIRSGDIEARLARWIRHLQDESAFVRSLRGRLVPPTVAEHDQADPGRAA